MMDKLIIIASLAALIAQSMPTTRASNLPSAGASSPEALALERALLVEANAASLLRASGNSQQPEVGEESYQRVYEAFTKLMQSTTNNSLGNVRRLVSRLNQLVGAPSASGPAAGGEPNGERKQTADNNNNNNKPKQQQGADESTEQILNRLDKVNKETDQHTLRQLNDDVSRLISTLNDSYLRNIRRVIERVNKVVGQPAAASDQEQPLHQSADRLDDLHQKQPGFPGWDEFIVAVDRMQKSLAHFVRSSTRLITSG